MITKLYLPILSASLLFSCSSAPEADHENSTVTIPAGSQTIPVKTQVMPTKPKVGNKNGIITIHTSGEGHDVWMTLDTSEENISLEIDLPNSKKEEVNTEVTEEDVSQASQEIQEKIDKHLALSQDYLVKGQNWLALEEINKGLKLNSENAQAYALKGSIYYQFGLMDKAKAAWKQAASIDPTMTDVATSLEQLF
jgi:tetratricopeptide (TPR) repeat protein